MMQTHTPSPSRACIAGIKEGVWRCGVWTPRTPHILTLGLRIKASESPVVKALLPFHISRLQTLLRLKMTKAWNSPAAAWHTVARKLTKVSVQFRKFACIGSDDAKVRTRFSVALYPLNTLWRAHVLALRTVCPLRIRLYMQRYASRLMLS